MSPPATAAAAAVPSVSKFDQFLCHQFPKWMCFWGPNLIGYIFAPVGLLFDVFQPRVWIPAVIIYGLLLWAFISAAPMSSNLQKSDGKPDYGYCALWAFVTYYALMFIVVFGLGLYRCKHRDLFCGGN